MKKSICILLCLILTASAVFAADTTEKNWFFSSKSRNERSVLPKTDEEKAIGIGKDEKSVYLTFDAGYENGNVEKIVDILKENNVTGAFFLLKHFIEENPELTKRMKENGNLVCNHTSNHKNIARISKEELKKEILTLEELYKNTTGYDMDKFFRPPEGSYSEESLNNVYELGYKTVFWSLAYADWDNNNQKSNEVALKLLNSRVHNGAVILLHPTSKTNAEILDTFIKNLKEQGYSFKNLNEL